MLLNLFEKYVKKENEKRKGKRKQKRKRNKTELCMTI
jgi:hypothetical protein